MKAAALFLAIVALGGSAAAARADDGAALYQQHCVACHQPAGAGAPGLAPPLTGAVAARGALPQGRSYLAQVVLHGLSGRISADGVDYNSVMPPQPQLSDADVAAVLSYVVGGFKAEAGAASITAAEVATARSLKPSAKELRALREATRAR